MDSNVVKCFICDVECAAEDKYFGANIARTLTMPMTSVLAKCLRTIVEAENEYFCTECVKKIEDYDQLVQLSLQIETELFELYRKKPTEPCYLLDEEILTEQDAINEDLLQDAFQGENESIIKNETSVEILTETSPVEVLAYDEMVVEYLDDYEAQSDDVDLAIEQKEIIVPKVEPNVDSSVDESTDTIEQKEQPKPRLRTRKGTTRSSTAKSKTMKAEVRNSRETSETEFKCEKCPFTSETQLALEEHKTIMHLDEMDKLVCDICGRSYKSKSALCVHLGTHNGRSSHECHICGKTFTQRGALVRHMPMHTGERPHQCDVCGKRFIHYSSFHMHQMIHTNERKKKCEICGSEFRSNSHMTRHMRSHTGEKPFACPICGQKFAQRYNMKTHYNTHQGIHRPQSRNHKCIICLEAFPRREKLNKHLRQSHRISDDDINKIAENGPDSEITQNIIERLRSTVYTKGDIVIEFVDVDDGETITADTK